MEYFGNDPIIYEKNNRNVNIIDLLQMNTHNRNERDILRSQNRNLHNRYNQSNNNDDNLSGEEVFCHLFFLYFKPSKIQCIAILLLNIFICGLGTILIGLNKKSVFYTLFGIIQCFSFSFLFIYSTSIQNKESKFLWIEPIYNLHLYFKVIVGFFYLSSIYIGIFRNFLFFNPRIVKFKENNERGLIIFFLNILIGGLGTIFIGVLRLVEEGSFCHKFKYIFFGIIQISGYLLTLFSICLLKSKIKFETIFLLCAGVCCYSFSFYTSYKYYKKITS